MLTCLLGLVFRGELVEQLLDLGLALRQLLGEQMKLPDTVWRRLNFAWIGFFGLMGLLNLWVAYTFTTDVWVNFKLFGGSGLMLVFTVAQGLYLSKYLEDDPAAVPPEESR